MNSNTLASVERGVFEILKDVMPQKEISISLESDLADDLGIDSLGYVVLQTLIEKEFDVEIKLDDFEKIKKARRNRSSNLLGWPQKILVTIPF